MKHEEERKRRINLTIWACSYEFYDTPIVSDGTYDEEGLKVDLNIETGRPDLDVWWKDNFSPYTGQWIHNHPELETHVKPLTEMVLGIREWRSLELSPGRKQELTDREEIKDELEFE